MDRLESIVGHSRQGSSSSRETTPQFSPAPPDLKVDLRKVRWGSNDVVAAEEGDPYASDDDSDAGGDGKGEEEEEEESASAWTRGISLAITATRGRLGCAYFDADTTKLLFLEDSEDSSLENWDLVTDIIEQLQPDTVLTAATADPVFLDALQACLAALAPDDGTATASSLSGASEPNHPIKLEFRPGREFFSGNGRAALAQVIVLEGGMYAEHEPGDDDDMSGGGEARDAYDFNAGRVGTRKKDREGFQSDRDRRNGELRLDSFVNGLASSPLTLGCAGALLTFLAGARATAGELDAVIQVRGIELMILEKVLHITTDALSSLQIFHAESHASVHSDKTKEGLSLFGIMNTARTPLGRALLRKWFLRPPLVLATIETRHIAVECFLRNENQHVAEAIQKSFRYIKNTPKTFKTIKDGKAVLKDWHAIWSFMYGAIQIRDSVSVLAHRNHVEIVNRYLTIVEADVIGELGRMINDLIDWEDSNLQKRVVIKSGVYKDLDELRRQYHGLSSLLSKVATQISEEIPIDFAESLSVVYFPQLGYLITIPYDSASGLEPPARDGWQYQFATEQSAYYKSDKCRDLDEHLGDLRSFISDKEIEILQALLNKVVAYGDKILEIATCLSEIDCLLAFAETARMYDWNRPAMTEDNVTEIKGGRHPLAELCVDSYVPNDARLVGSKGVEWDYVPPVKTEDEEMAGPAKEGATTDENSMIIVTGANYSGKSIYLKQIALITFMAHLGYFVPAESATIGLTDRILVRIATVESVTRGSSAFMIDLHQISFALRNATPKSLIVIDEFGKGTDSNDGAGLFWAVIEHLVRRGIHAPRVVVATHFCHVLANELISPSLPITYAHMEIVIQPVSTRPSVTARSSTASTGEASSQHPAVPEVTYLYRLQPGLSPSSHAFSCALQFGIAPATVARASYIARLLSTFDIAELLNEDLDDQELAELAESEAIARRFLAVDLNDGVEREPEDWRRLIGEVLRGKDGDE
ncbi:hypothetical protein RQP46_002249 [Phenoliferia psychrophenolica]